jgi:hypothetical protein
MYPNYASICCSFTLIKLQTQKVDGRRPYQHPVIVSIIGTAYFSRFPNIIDANQDRFKPSGDENSENELPDAMISSAATAVSVLLQYQQVFLITRL